MLFVHICSKEELVNDDWSIPIVFIWYSIRDDRNIHFITKNCCGNVLIDRMESTTLFNTLDLTHWVTWGYLLSTCKHKYSLPSGGKCVVFGNSTGKRGKVVINGVKRGGVDLAWTLIFYFWGVTQEWISSVFEMSTVFWMEVLSLCWSWWYIKVGVELVVYDVWFAEDNNTGFLSIGVDIFDRLYL